MELLLAAVVAYFGGTALLGTIPVNGEFAAPAHGVPLCVRSNGIHADFVVPAAHETMDWRTRHPPAHFPRLDRAPGYIAFGWGDRGFYLDTPTWADLKLGTALKAVSGLGEAAMHVEYVDRPARGDRVACTRITEEQYGALARYIQGSFNHGEGAAPIRIEAPGYGPADAFYEAKGAYSLLFTCNEWLRRGLSESGIRAPAWSPFDGALLRQLRAVETAD
jgi:uncharacterized protein (TIGR02117 family)